MMPRTCFFFIALLSAAALRAQQPASPDPNPQPRADRPGLPTIAVDVRCLCLPQELAVPLVRQLRSGKAADENAAVAKLDELLEKGTAKLLGWPLVLTHSGEKATAEEIEEIRYATEFEGGSITVNLADNDGALTRQPKTIEGNEPSPMATNFETRNTGITLEVDPAITTDGKDLNISFAMNHVRLKSVDKVVVEHERTTEKKVERTVVEQPRFTNFRALSSLTMKSGEHKLIGLYRAPEGENQLELFILTAEVHEHK